MGVATMGDAARYVVAAVAFVAFVALYVGVVLAALVWRSGRDVDDIQEWH
jgi:uncharacterized iron-regulated membrane protein